MISAPPSPFFPLHPGVCVETDSQWTAEIDQLQQLIDKLECKVGQQMELVVIIHDGDSV